MEYALRVEYLRLKIYIQWKKNQFQTSLAMFGSILFEFLKFHNNLSRDFLLGKAVNSWHGKRMGSNKYFMELRHDHVHEHSCWYKTKLFRAKKVDIRWILNGSAPAFKWTICLKAINSSVNLLKLYYNFLVHENKKLGTGVFGPQTSRYIFQGLKILLSSFFGFMKIHSP